MPRSFNVSASVGEVLLDRGRGNVAFTVSNINTHPVRGRAKPTPISSAQETWLSVEGDEERDFKTNDTQQVAVRITVPQGTPAGRYAFRLDMLNTANPDEDYSEGPNVAFDVRATEAPHKPIPVWGIAAALLMLIGGAVGMWLVSRPELKVEFAAAPLTPEAGAAVQFTDQSDSRATAWNWDFHDGSPQAIVQNPKHVYNQPGKYDVTLQVVGPNGTQTITKKEYVTVISKPIAKSILWTGAGKVFRLDIETSTVQPLITSVVRGNYQGIALRPDGDREIYATGTSSGIVEGPAEVLRYNRANGSPLPAPGQSGARIATSSDLDFPGNLAFGPDGNLYVVDHSGNRILRFNPDTGAPLPAPGKAGALFAELASAPLSLAFGPDKNIYVVGHGDGIQKINGNNGASLGVFGQTAGRTYEEIAFTRSGKLLATTMNQPIILQFSGDTGAALGPFAAAGHLLGVGDDDRIYSILGGGSGASDLLTISDAEGTRIKSVLFQGGGNLSGGNSFNFMVVEPISQASSNNSH